MQKTYVQRFDVSRPGFLSGLGVPRVRACRNSADTKNDYYTFAIPAAPVASTLYALSDALGNTASYTTDATPTQAELGAGLLNAVRTSNLYDVAVPKLEANVLTLTARSPIAPLVLTTTTLAAGTAFNFGAVPALVPFGVLVGRRITDLEDEARLLTLTTDIIVGVAMSTYSAEKDAVGPDAKVSYKANEAMDVLDRCNNLDGIWVPCVETDLNVNDVLYASVAPATPGHLTRNATGTILVKNSSLVRGTVVNGDGSRMVLLSINFF